ncbi:NitT/TauT family transport system substrate-binding protein [Franzmannia pantelleriensis]|uniref:NitT/TauT family transport system substrate-binding protein n=1 Tax=Franzmannia pantelleriensis TaxID=48727 RepID=A0A1G9H8V1_9GAMM|nr:ABC transporter substrate-binding protein [Halomonas pantelleriensis]SDL09234.1 NitT/TauT family transport system substrate-binding protein [Halomonas pantelleriensis]
MNITSTYKRIAFGAGLLALGASAHTQADDMDTILINEAFHSLLYLPVYVAKHEGLFNAHNIDVPVVRSAGSGPAALASVLSGESQFSVHGPEHVGFAQEQGGSGKAISAVANSAPVWVLAHPDLDYSSPADLQGKEVVVGLAPGTSNTLIKRLIEDAGLNGEVSLTEVQNGSELGPVLSGRGDIAVAYQPQVEQGISQGLEIIHAFTDDYPEYAFSTINTSQEMIDDNPDLVMRFVSAINDSLALIHSDADTAKAVARMEFGDLQGDVVDAAVQRMIDNNVYPESVMITEDAFTNAIEMQQFVGNIQGEMYYDDIVDASFASEVVQ